MSSTIVTRLRRRRPRSRGPGLPAVGPLLRGLTVAVMALAAVGAGAQETVERDSEPLRSFDSADSAEARSLAEIGPSEAMIAPLAPGFADKVTIGLNQEISRRSVDSNFIPPDTMGAVGPNHIVEIINGNFEIFDKTTGASLDSRSLDSFWVNTVGLSAAGIQGFTFDPRIVFDPDSGVWFAVSIDSSDTNGDGVRDSGNQVYVARTDTDDPEGDWDGVRFAADTVGGPEFHDYPTLALDADGVYICTQDFAFDATGTNGESCYSIPKADLLQAAPTVANMTRFEATPAGLPVVTGSIQPSLDFGLTDGRAPLFGAQGGALVRSDIFGAQTATATLGTVIGVIGDPGHATPPAARQPNPGGIARTLENVAPRFVGNVVELNDSLWAVHAVMGSSGANSALRWYEIDEPTNTVLQTGLIDDPDRDFHEPSIAVNEYGDVMIGYTCSGPTLAASTCVSVGETTGGATTFEPPQILAIGAGYYYREGSGTRNRWGDYSATVLDPTDSCTFYAFQEFVAVAAPSTAGPAQDGGQWGTQVTELTINGCANEADLRIAKECKPDQPLAAGATATCTITVENLGPTAALAVTVADRHVSNGSFDFGTVATSKGTCSTTPNPQNGSGDVDCELGRLVAGETVTITVPLSADEPQDINDRATVSSDTPDPNLSNNEAQDGVSVYGVADLAISKSDSPDPVTAGSQLTYELSVENNGPSTAVNVLVEDRLPAGVSVDSVSATGGGSCNTGVPGDATNLTTCAFDSMASGDSETMTIVVTVNADTTGLLQNDASVDSETFDPDNSNNLATETTTVEVDADLSVTKSDSPDPVPAGGNLSYTVTVANAGPSTATDVELTDTLPAETTFVSASIPASPASCVHSGGTVTCALGDLAPGDDVTVFIDVTVDPSVPDGTTITNTASVSSASPDSDLSNNSVSEDTLVEASADLWIDKTGNKLTGNSSGTVEYRITVHNNEGCSMDDPEVCGTGGPSDAVDVVVVDPLPLDSKKFRVEYVSESCVYDDTAHTVTCTTPLLIAGDEVVHIIQADVKGKAEVVSNTATVSSATADPDAGNNTDTFLISIKGGKGNGGGPK
jgi:uncharacterized repeat protein (TIGR01451 family)